MKISKSQRIPRHLIEGADIDFENSRMVASDGSVWEDIIVRESDIEQILDGEFCGYVELFGVRKLC